MSSLFGVEMRNCVVGVTTMLRSQLLFLPFCRCGVLNCAVLFVVVMFRREAEW
jgi:hypothetical protein